MASAYPFRLVLVEAGDGGPNPLDSMHSRRWLAVLLALGLYLTLRGYHSRDGDQAYRLPLLLHKQNPQIFAHDPFVRAFDKFNPHEGSLALLDGLSHLTGLSPALFLLFCGTFLMTGLGIDRLARAVWPDSGPRIGYLAFALVLIAKAGNLGTNHLFEAMLLDRLMAFGLGWLALSGMIVDPARAKFSSAAWIAGAAFIHPSLGLQIGMLAFAGWLVFACMPQIFDVTWKVALAGASLVLLALMPSFVLMMKQGNQLFEGLSSEDFLALSASIQSPQHMLPHLWRMPQWLAAACYPIVASLAFLARPLGTSVGRNRLVLLLSITLLGLIAATIGIEVLGSVRLTVFQPFRVATLARGFCLILMTQHLLGLWNRGDRWSRIRCGLLVAGLSGDWAFVAATLVEVSAFLSETIAFRGWRLVPVVVLAGCLNFLSKHDTESGHLVLISAVGATLGVSVLTRLPRRIPQQVVLTFSFSLAWLIPISAMILPTFHHGAISRKLATHCRFGEWADDDVERLALWCRENTPIQARFVGPPGPKTFRLWSHRDLAFNRSASPYHAAGLVDWSNRFREHVGFHGPISSFAAAYLADRLALERGFDRMDAEELASLARKQGADFLLASVKTEPGRALRRIRVEGRYAIYRVLPEHRESEPQFSDRMVSSKPRM